MRTILAILIFLNTITVFAITKDDKKKDEEGIIEQTYTEGVIYSLPRTGVVINVEASREVLVHGPFYQFSEKYLGIENAPASDNESWAISKINVAKFSEADPKQVYKAMGESAALLNLTEDGVLAGINCEAAIDVQDLVTGNFMVDDISPDFPFTDLSMWGMFTKADSASNYAMITKTLEEKAAESAETIMNLRNARFRLLTNADDEPLPDGKSFEVMVEELGRLEREQLALFIGKKVKKSYKYSFKYIPQENNTKGQVIFRFSENRGVLPVTDLTGKPVLIEISKVDELTAQQKKLTSSENPDAGESGVYYRIPGVADVNISNGLTVLASTRLTIAQMGNVAPLPEDFLDGEYKVHFHPNTGAIKSISK